jgi:hypothetical protein
MKAAGPVDEKDLIEGKFEGKDCIKFWPNRRLGMAHQVRHCR